MTWTQTVHPNQDSHIIEINSAANHQDQYDQPQNSQKRNTWNEAKIDTNSGLSQDHKEKSKWPTLSATILSLTPCISCHHTPQVWKNYNSNSMHLS